MSVFEYTVDDSLFLYELEVQGNTGDYLEYYCEVIEGLFFDDLLWLTDISLIEEVIDFSEDFTPSHEPYCVLFESVNFSEDFVTPSRVYGSFVSVISKPEVTPVEIYWFGVDVVHGPDIFYQECIESLNIDSDSVVANMYVDTIYESFWIDLETPAGVDIPFWVVSRFVATDIINFRHDVSQEYYFNNVLDERLYPFDDISRCFGQSLSDSLRLVSAASLAHGRVIDEHVTIAGECGSAWYGALDANDRFTAFDFVLDEKYYDHILEEVISVIDDFSITPTFSMTASSVFQVYDDIVGSTAYSRMVVDSLVLSSAASYGYFVLHNIDDEISIVDSVALKFTSLAIISDAISILGETTSSASILSLALDSLVVYDDIQD